MPRRIPSGQLRQRITIRRPRSGVDEFGQPLDGFDTVHRQIPAAITAVAGGEGPRGEQIQATTTHLVEFRYLTGVNPDCEFVWHDGPIDRVLGVLRADDPDNHRRMITAQTVEVRA